MARRFIRIRRRLRNRLIGAGLALAAAITLALLVSASLARAAPSWWRQYRPTAELRDHATAVENAAVSQIYRNRPAEPGADARPWSISVKDADASAWLSGRMPGWLDAHDDLPGWPDTLAQPQVHFEPGLIRIGVLYRGERGDRVLSASARPELRADGSLWLRAAWVQVGRLPIPAALVLDRANLREVLPDSFAGATPLADILRGRAPLAREPALILEDGRAVHLLGLSVSEGRVRLDCVTEHRGRVARN